MKSLTIVFPEKNKVDITPIDIKPLKDDEALCKAEKSLISTGTEMTCLKGIFDPGTNWYEWGKYPFYPGYAVSGEVLEVGKNVKTLKPGDIVYSECGHTQYFVSQESMLIKLPDGINCEQSTWVSLGRVAQNAARRGQIQMGETVAVIGAGQIGLLAMQFFRICGATRIVAVDAAESRASLALKCGATDCFIGPADKAVERVMEITGGRMADVVCDATGHPAVLASACKLARVNGKIILVGDTSVPSQQALGPGVVSNGLTILGVHGWILAQSDNPFYPWTWKLLNETTMTYIIQKRLLVDHLVSHRISPEQAPEFYMKLLNDRSFALGVMIDWSSTK